MGIVSITQSGLSFVTLIFMLVSLYFIYKLLLKNKETLDDSWKKRQLFNHNPLRIKDKRLFYLIYRVIYLLIGFGFVYGFFKNMWLTIKILF